MSNLTSKQVEAIFTNGDRRMSNLTSKQVEAITHAETIVTTNNNGIELCRPRYGFRWSIQQPTTPGNSRCHYIGSERQVRAMWNAHYSENGD
jgi:hypothetical protein